MTDEGQKAIEAAAIAICEHVGFKWDSITKEARENYCAIARKSNSAYLAALPDCWVAPRPDGMNDEAWEALKQLSPPPGLED